MPEIKIPKKDEVPAKVKIVFEDSEKKENKEEVKQEVKTDITEKALSSFIETAKNNEEVRKKIAELIFSSLDLKNFKEKLVEEALKDSELRNKIMLELLKKI
ncbi:MAG: hypothetical protein QW609_04430 [Candidatus Aenigmatarchaeota archaeon]